MKLDMERFCASFPTLYLLIVGVGGTALILAVPTIPLYLLGAPNAADSLADALMWVGVVWMLVVFSKVRSHYQRK